MPLHKKQGIRDCILGFCTIMTRQCYIVTMTACAGVRQGQGSCARSMTTCCRCHHLSCEIFGHCLLTRQRLQVECSDHGDVLVLHYTVTRKATVPCLSAFSEAPAWMRHATTSKMFICALPKQSPASSSAACGGTLSSLCAEPALTWSIVSGVVCRWPRIRRALSVFAAAHRIHKTWLVLHDLEVEEFRPNRLPALPCDLLGAECACGLQGLRLVIRLQQQFTGIEESHTRCLLCSL